MDLAVTERLKEHKIPFFFNELIIDWDVLNGILDLGVTDVYIVENLCFELDAVAAKVHSNNTNIRVYPNVAQSSWKNTPSLKKFFIRPEDIDTYEEYVDTIEFWDGKVENQKHMEWIFQKVYTKDKKWFGPLKEIIYDFDGDLDSRFVIPRFAEMRIRCGKKCQKGGKCNICGTVEDLSKTLEKAEIMVKIDKK